MNPNDLELLPLLDGFREELARTRSEAARLYHTSLTAAFKATKLETWDQFNRHALNRIMGWAQKFSPKVVDRVFRACKRFAEFVAWNVEGTTDPIAGLHNRWRIKTAKPRERRCLTKEEWTVLKGYLNQATERLSKFSPRQRLLLYATAIQTGYRLRELLSLRCDSLGHTEAQKWYLSLPGRKTKNRNEARQYIPADLASELGTLTAGRNGLLFDCKISPARWKNIGGSNAGSRPVGGEGLVW